MSGTHAIRRAAEAIERLKGLPGGGELLAQARLRGDVALVGGAVRDLLLGHWPRELDVTVVDDSPGLAAALAGAISPSERPYGRPVEPTLHERFGTASIAWEYGRIDVAELRAESYPSPGALPEVRPGTVEEDLARRDFTVNAISLALGGERSGQLLAVDHALEDLGAGRLRVLHERSFLDDPTRLLRLARYAARLRFEIEPATLGLASRAIAAGALGTVSGGRIGAELWLAAREADGRAAFDAMGELGILGALGLPERFDDQLAAEAEALLPGDGARDVLLMALAMHPLEDDDDPSADGMLERMGALEFGGELAGRVFEGANGVEGLARRIRAAAERGPAAVYAELDGSSVEKVAITGASPPVPASRGRRPCATGWQRSAT